MAAAEPAEVLIVGAGPTGLVLALWLTRLGVQVKIIDKAAEPATTSRAVAVQARTLEFYRQVGLADSVIARGREVSALNLWVSGRRVARAVFGPMGRGTPTGDASVCPIGTQWATLAPVKYFAWSRRPTRSSFGNFSLAA
jgi:2-polyprenyl-6-methoxyphenol hydroxylase-like FAD-dependent oxidoreductase